MPHKYNFNSGPSVLPQTVFQQASQAVVDFNGTGLSILEIGHRTPLFQEVLDEAVALVKELMQLNNDMEVLFLHGGATQQFLQVPINLMPPNGSAAYLDAGIWGTKAIKEAKNWGTPHVLGSSKDKNYTYIPKGWQIPEGVAYVHLTSNNTIEGTQQFEWPETSAPIVCDMSSDILSRSLDFNRFGLIYAGAQKNLGAAGVTLVVINKALAGKAYRNIPTILDYKTQIENGSMVNTPPVFAIYVCLLTLRWLKQQGGVAGIAPVNLQKATLLYNTLDKLETVFHAKVAKEDRSQMNVVWEMHNKAQEPAFLALCHQNNLVALEGHRTVGGFRASLYNAMPLQGVELLTEIMEFFANKNG